MNRVTFFLHFFVLIFKNYTLILFDKRNLKIIHYRTVTLNRRKNVSWICVYLQQLPPARRNPDQPQDKPPDWFTSYLETVSVLCSLGLAALLAQMDC